MKLCLQFGWGMIDHVKVLTKKWADNTTVILSPKDLEDAQLVKVGQHLVKNSAEPLLDPQMYALPITTVARLKSHAFWPKVKSFPTGTVLKNSIQELITLNTRIGATRIIIPGPLADNVDAAWLKLQKDVIDEIASTDLGTLAPIFTIALGPDALKNNAAVQTFMEKSESWAIRSVYLILKHPQGDYLVDSSIWLVNALDIVAGLRLRGIEVIVGYCSHQKLIMAAAGANAICSGSWLNVRAFCTDKFKTSEDMAQRSTWYYAPHLLTEYKSDALDVAHRSGVLGEIETAPGYLSPYSDPLFTAPQPSLSTYTEQNSFRHYLQCLKVQSLLASKPTYKETFDGLQSQLTTAETELKKLRKMGITGQQRDFLAYIDNNRNALNYIDTHRGSLLARHWSKLT